MLSRPTPRALRRREDAFKSFFRTLGRSGCIRTASSVLHAPRALRTAHPPRRHFGRVLKPELIAKVPKGRPRHPPPQSIEHKSVSAPSQTNTAATRARQLVRLTPTPRQGLQCLENCSGTLDAQNGCVVIQETSSPVGQLCERVLIVSLRTPCGRIKEGDDTTLYQGDKGHRTTEKLLNSPRRSKAERAIRIRGLLVFSAISDGTQS